MSMMGQMSFFSGLQISQSTRGIFINQSKYAYEIVKKYGMLTSNSVDTPMVEKHKLDASIQGTPVDATHYCGMIESIMYLTSIRPDLIYVVCLCARYQAKPTKKYLHAVTQIFQYLKGTIHLGLWYSKDTGISLTAYSDVNQQKSTAISSTKAEYIALSGSCAQILWMRSQLIDYGFQFNKMRDSNAYKTYIAYAAGAASPKMKRKFKKPASPLKKRALVNVEEEEPEPAMKVAQVKKALKRSQRETTIHQVGGSDDGTSSKLGVSDEPKGKSIDTSEGTSLKPGVLDVSKADSFKTADINKTDDEEDDDFVYTLKDYVPTDVEEFNRINKEMYNDVNVKLKDLERKGEEKDDEEMTDPSHVDAEHENVILDFAGGHNKDDAQEIVTAGLAIQKIEVPLQTIHAAVKYEVLIIVKEYIGTSLDDALHKALLRHTTKLIKEHSVPLDVIDVLQQQPKPQKNEDVVDKGVADKLKNRNPDNDIDEVHPAGPDQGLKRKKTCKETKPSKKAKSSETSKGTSKSYLKSNSKFVQAEETVFEARDTQVPHDL
nr:hypothetical protein [Tanacetum cinerariifolium]